MNKKILILPAIQDHIEAVLVAKKKGYKAITCDNMPDNPAHAVADESYNIDLLNYDAIVEIVRKKKISYIWPYSTDIGALTASWISDALNLNLNSFETVKIMSDKTLFRRFLQNHNFNYPRFKYGSSLAKFKNIDLNFPLIIKPSDRASSKGVKIIDHIDDFSKSFEYAKSFSIAGNVIIEEYIDTDNLQLHGDAIIYNGELIFFEVGDQFFGNIENNLAPIGTTLPSIQSADIIEQLKKILIQFLNKVGYKYGGVNIEARIDKQDRIFLIEVAPRSGGNYIPQLLSYYCGFDIKEILLSSITHEEIQLSNYKPHPNTFQFIWRANKSGKLKEIKYLKKLNILSFFPILKVGNIVSAEAGVNNIIAIFIIRGNSRKQVEDVFSKPEKYFYASIESSI